MDALEYRGTVVGLSLQTARSLLGENIARLLKEQGKPLGGLALHCGVTLPMASRWKSGSTLPTRYIDQIADYFKVPVAELFRPLGASVQIEFDTSEISLDEAFRGLAKHLGYNVRRTRDPLKKT